MITNTSSTQALSSFHPAVQHWFAAAFPEPTTAQALAWPPISQHKNTLLLAPTGSGKTLSAFLVAIDRIMFPATTDDTDVTKRRVKTLYISPLKALGVDVERNLRAPLAGITAVAEREGLLYHPPVVGVRSGDTPAAERHRMTKQAPDILITTPESLYLILTSKAREILTSVDTVIIDEIHSMVATKRGSHLFLSLERLERLRQQSGTSAPLQRIGLSATQRPLHEVARLLGGFDATSDHDIRPVARNVEIVEAGRRKALELRVEVPIEDMANLSAPTVASGPASAGPSIPSIWPAIHPRLVELIREHRSTMIFVNSRRLAERMAQAINEVAEEEIALAHHGSVAKDTRLYIEDRLKRGSLPAIVATSSLELGIDMGAVDLVIQIESPPTIASGIQRIGRSGHQVGALSRGVIFPKFRGDLLACSAAVERMLTGQVEETLYPRNPLDVLAQQIVAMVALEPQPIDELYQTIRSAAPFSELTRNLFESVLDLLSGRYPSDEFAELRARVNWDRVTGLVAPRRGTQRIAIANAGTIPDRGLYGVFLAGSDEKRSSRVGELDEEMVFESKPGEVFLLGASSWRILDITNDQVIVEPAPGEPGRMPFWRGDGPGRPLEYGQAIGQLTRELLDLSREQAEARLTEQHGLDRRAAWNLLNYLHEQVEATGDAPSDSTIVVERFLDEIGDWRVALMMPFGSRVHAPWATAVAAQLRSESTGEVDMMWSDDGIVFRIPGSDEPPAIEAFFPTGDTVEEIVVRELGGTALFAARFRENAARALLLPRRQPGRRTPLWLQRRKSADLLNVASRYEKFPIMLETYRECLRDVFDLRGLKQILSDIERRQIRVRSCETRTPSPFAASLMFNYTGNFLYNGDAPLAERRAATLALDHAQLRELLGDAEMRELLDPNVVDQLVLELHRRTPRYALRDGDSLHDLLRFVGDLSLDELKTWPTTEDFDVMPALQRLIQHRRVLPITIGSDTARSERYIAAEDAGRYRDAIGFAPPLGVPDAFLEPVADPLVDLVGRYARTHVPFPADDVAQRLGLGVAPVHEALHRMLSADRVVEGEFLPGGRGREWCDVEVLKKLKRRSLAKLRAEIEPVEPARYAQFLTHWQSVIKPRRGLDGLLDVIEQLQGLALSAHEWESSVLPQRVSDFSPAQLDELCAAGEVVWQGGGSMAGADGRIRLYLADAAALLSPALPPIDDEREQSIYDWLSRSGAVFFDPMAAALGGFRNDILDSLWQLAWAGHVTNDTLTPLRALRRAAPRSKGNSKRRSHGFRSRRAAQPPGAEGRWSVWSVAAAGLSPASNTERQTAIANQLLERYGVLTRECVATEGIVGGFSGLYPILKAMEEAGRIRRGYFVAGQGAAQFAAAGAEDRLRQPAGNPHPSISDQTLHASDQPNGSDSARRPELLIISATDPANPYGASLRWPRDEESPQRPQRTVGARVVLCDGQLVGYLNRSAEHLTTFLPTEEPERAHAKSNLLTALATFGDEHTLYLKQIDGQSIEMSGMAYDLRDHGFVPYAHGFQRRAKRR